MGQPPNRSITLQPVCTSMCPHVGTKYFNEKAQQVLPTSLTPKGLKAFKLENVGSTPTSPAQGEVPDSI